MIRASMLPGWSRGTRAVLVVLPLVDVVDVLDEVVGALMAYS